ncbi:hypothetical protein RND81_02G092700 [Saponaria officinalis]|uniref:Uncharacterized protein n=1 Tax=Saponaria officinalis TaxID=3572 RepID=A0AAW1MTH0_SAPOF
MKTIIAILAFLAISSLAFAQEQYDAQKQYELYDQQLASANQGVTPQWFIPQPFFFPHPFMPSHLPLPHFPSLPPMSSPDMPFLHPKNSPAHDNLSPCMDDLRSFISTHKFSMSSSCCSALKDVKIPPVQKLVSQYCSSSPSA